MAVSESHFFCHVLLLFWFLDALAKFRKATLSFMSVRLSVRMEQLGTHWTDFGEILYLSLIRKPVEKVQVLLKSDKNNG
jgi:hypothetical protein